MILKIIAGNLIEDKPIWIKKEEEKRKSIKDKKKA